MNATVEQLNFDTPINIGAVRTKDNGEYFIWYTVGSDTYGLTRPTKAAPHCGYASLAALFTAKGL